MTTSPNAASSSRSGNVNPVAELVQLISPSEAYTTFRGHIQIDVKLEEVGLTEALGRTLATTITAPTDLPTFPRSTVDGYAVRAIDTFGSSDARPARLELAGESLMGQTPTVTVSSGRLAKIHTGAMVPDGADAVVMVEYTRDKDGNIEVNRQVEPGENRIAAGEDVVRGDELMRAGHRLRPQDIGGLAAIGLTKVVVARRPRIGIISGGDEVVPPDVEPGPAQVRDINMYSLAALALDCGAEPVRLGIAADRFDVLAGLVDRALRDCDMVIVSGGSSVGTRDLTRAVIDSYGEPGVLVHGVALRPGKPTILAVANGKPFFGLPGNPVSAMCTFELFVRPTIQRYLGQPDTPPPVTVQARLLRDVPSVSGLEHYIQVRLVWRGGALCADPVLGKSNLIFTMVRADGFFVIPIGHAKIPEGETIGVQPYRLWLPSAELS